MPNRPGPTDRKIRAQILEQLKATPGNYDAISAKFNVSSRAIREWERKESAEPRGIPPPDSESGTKGPRYKSAPGRRPITEQTAGMLVAGIFTLAAIIDGEAWILNPTERDSLAGPLADSMRSLPTPIANGVNTYAAPITFTSALVTVVAHKVRVRGEKRKTTPPSPLRPVPANAPPPGPATPQRNPGTPGPFAAAPAASNGSKNGSVEVDPAVSAALEAARGRLVDLDPMEDAEAAFS